MRPAFSLIFFTTLSASGFGLAFWTALVGLLRPAGDASLALWGYGLALVLVLAGLACSVGHLGNPQRAWRAFSQWRSSWLSREAVLAALAVATLLLALAGAAFPELIPRAVRLGAAAALLILSGLTSVATAMIYRSLRTIPQWDSPHTLPCFLLPAWASGAVALAGLAAALALEVTLLPWGVVAMWVALAGLGKWLYWRWIDRARSRVTIESATGLGGPAGRGGTGQTVPLDATHARGNFVHDEMGFRVARRHADRLRRIALRLGYVLPVGLLLVAGVLPGLEPFRVWLIVPVWLCFQAGEMIARWLFFGQAEHVVQYYYPRPAGAWSPETWRS